MVKIRLKRMGTNKRPFYRIVVADSRSPRDGKFIDQVGIYHPLAKEDEQVMFDKDRVEKWFYDGAEPTSIVKKLLNKKGFRFDKQLLKQEK